MAITGATKMRAAKTCAISYWGTHKQTFRFEHRNENFLEGNWNAAADLVSAASNLGLRDESSKGMLWKGVPRELILKFFERYTPHKAHADLDLDVLLPFLRADDGRLEKWNVGIVESGRRKLSAKALGAIGNVGLVTRAKLKDSGKTADIKALMSKGDVRFDCSDELEAGESWEDLKQRRLASVGQVPLLLLYAIDRNSTPREGSKERVKMDAVEDVLGFGIVFPGSVTEGAQFVSVELETVSADEIDKMEAEEQAQAEAAGVE
jgi:hypothetical protein